MKKTAVIFDMDGVVSDTQKFHAEVESLILKECTIDMEPETITKRFAGVADDVMFAEIFAEHNVTVDSVEDIVFSKWDKMRTVAHGRITAIEGAVELIKMLHENGIKLAIASASTKSFINEVVTSLEVEDYFDVLVSAQEVKHGKPAPDIFLLAADKLGVHSESAVVIEDGISGMKGAAAANMTCIGLVADTSTDCPATVCVSSLLDVNLDLIHSL